MVMAGRRLNAATGRIELSDGQKVFLDWLTGEREEGDTQVALAARLGVSTSTIRAWKRDKAFLEEWEYRLRRTHSHPEIISDHLTALNKKARTGDVQAIKLYHDIVERMWPEKRDDGPEDLAELSDAELADLAESIGFLRDRGAKD